MRSPFPWPGVIPVVCALMLAGAVSREAEVAAAPAAGKKGGNVAQVAKAEQQFALDLYASMREGAEGENLFFSPHSVYSVMAMTAEGAGGETAEEMAKILGLETEGNPKSQFAKSHQGLADLASSLRGDGGKESHTLLTANALWVDKSYPLAAGFQQALKPYLSGGGGVFTCNFHNSYPAESQRIDQWCDDNTRGHISSIMPKLTPEEAKNLHLVLTNAVYFEGKWVEPFQPKDTQKESFHLAGGEDVETAMMRTWDFTRGRYGAVDGEGNWFDTPDTFDREKPRDEQNLYPGEKGFTMVELPYKGDRLSMLLIAPRERDGLEHVEKLLSAEKLAAWTSKMESRKISSLRVPRLELSATYSMGERLAGMGMQRAFTLPKGGEGADFSRMVASSDPNLQLYLSLVIHKAKLKVDEQGTVAAAVTAVVPPPAAAPPSSIFPFHPDFAANRPFLMLIRDRESGAILFMGRINDPRSEAAG